MIRVIATITCAAGKRDAVLGHMRANLPNVLAEDGCLLYEPCVAVDPVITTQLDHHGDQIVVVEAWDSLDHLDAHLKAPHMAAYREQVKGMVEGVTLQVVEPA